MKAFVLGVLFLFATQVFAQGYNTGLPVPGLPPSTGPQTMANSTSVTIATDQPPIGVSGTIGLSGPIGIAPNTNGVTIDSTTIGSGAPTSFVPPLHAVGFQLEASSSNSQNLRWAVGGAATTTLGSRLEPGRDSNYVNAATTVSVIAEAGAAQEVVITWVLSQ